MIIAQLLHLESESRQRYFYLHKFTWWRNHRSIYVYDTMQFIKCDVTTICISEQCASAAAVLLAAGTKGKRFALPNARILIHQPLGGAQGQATEINSS